MYIDDHFAIVEDDIGMLLLACSRTNAPPFRHSFPQKVPRNEEIPILAEIDDNLQRLQRIVESLVQVKSRLTQWSGRTNDARPVGTLPAEILSDIFSRVQDDATNDDRPGAAVRLSHVNSTWRDICLAQGSLWTDIYAEWRYERQDVWLERSKQRPLWVFAEAEPVSLSPQFTAAIDRIGSITSWVNDSREGYLFPAAVAWGRLPSLRRIDLIMLGVRHMPTMEQWIFNLPNLQHVTLRGVSFISLIDIENFPSLSWTYLDISGNDNTERWFIKLLRACARLHTLGIRHNKPFRITEVEELRLDGTSPSTPTLFPQLKVLYIETEQEDDYIVYFLSRFMVAPVLTILQIVVKADHRYPDSQVYQWHASLDIIRLLEHSPLLETLKIYGRRMYICAIIRVLAHHRRNLPSLRKLGVNCRHGSEAMWSDIIGLVTAWAVYIDAATDAIKELDLFDAPTGWRKRTITHVGLLRFTKTDRTEADNLFQSQRVLLN